jgi:hypothetical protein
MRFCKLDWKPDTGTSPRVISGTRVIYEITVPVELTTWQQLHLPVVLALLAKDIGIEEQRLDAMVEAGGLTGVMVRTGT